MSREVVIHGEDAFVAMRKACRLAAETLDYIAPFVEPGVSTERLDDLCAAFIAEHGAISACLNYKGYPKTTCISVNHVICHGIPSPEKILKNGDILNIDVTVIVDGWYGDSSRMYYAGEPKLKARRLVETTYEAMMRGIEVAKPGNTLGDIGWAIQSFAEKQGYSIVRDFCGHGVGQVFHAPPNVVHFGRPGQGMELVPGMIFTIEPMLNVGRYETKILSDGWTAVTRDKSLSAQFEHTVGLTEDGCEIFTLSPKGWHEPPYVDATT